MSPRSPRRARPALDVLEDRQVLSFLTPAQVQHAYGVDAISYSWNGQPVSGTGAGQTIAIVGAYHNPYLLQEYQTFNAAFGLPSAPLYQVNLAGGAADGGWAEEQALDVQWAHAIAPGATIYAVEARSPSLNDLMYAVNYARQIPGVSVVSMSWGSSEFRGQASYDAILSTPAGHNGVTFVAATGDSGASAGAQWPAASTHVVAVGGTTLVLDAAGNAVSETAWSGGGGGYSRIVAEPSYQRSVQKTGRRSTPDVSMVADPATGGAVYTISPGSGHGYWRIFGGTSLSAPLFSGLVAIANQGRQLRGLNTLDGFTQTLPTLYAAGAASYRDVTAGYNGFRAGAGYDLATGRGTPHGAALVSDLTNVVTYASVTTSRSTAPSRTARPRVRLALEAWTSPAATTPQPALGALHDLALERVGIEGIAPLTPSRHGGRTATRRYG